MKFLTSNDIGRPSHPLVQAPEVEQFLNRVSLLTYEECESLATARDTARDTARATARDTAWATARDTAWDTARDTARDTAWDTAWATARAIADACSCLTLRDLIGTGVAFKQEHYDILTEIWATTIGKVHPNDRDRMME